MRIMSRSAPTTPRERVPSCVLYDRKRGSHGGGDVSAYPKMSCACRMLLPKIATWLGQLIRPEREGEMDKDTIFHGVSAPEICIADYIERLALYSGVGAPELVLVVLYIRRLLKLHPRFPCSDRSIHRTLLTVLLVTVKMHRDSALSNKFYSVVGGIPPPELARLERCMLRLLNYRLFVTVEEYESEAMNWSVEAAVRATRD